MDPRARRLLLNVVPTLVALAIVYLAVFGDHGLVRRHRLNEELARFERQLQASQAENAVLAREIDRLKRDPVGRQRAAAEELGLVPPNSTVYRFAP